MNLNNISAFLQSPDKKGAVDIYCGDEYAMTLSEDTVIEAGLRIGMPLDSDALEKIERSKQKTRVRAKAYDLLSYGDMSVKTMRSKLSRYDFDEQIIEEVIGLLVEYGYLDDGRYAAALVKYLATTKCYGPRRISQELFAKGVDRQTADIALESADVDFYETVKTHIPRGFDFTDRKAVARLYGQLVRKGFDYDMINSNIKEPEQFDD